MRLTGSYHYYPHLTSGDLTAVCLRESIIRFHTMADSP